MSSQSDGEMQEISRNSVSKPFECSKCKEVFDRASRLDCHTRRVHLQEKSHVCGVCGKGFFRKNDLLTHLNIHLGTNQSVCDICGRKFNHVSNLIRHRRTHLGSKPYPCVICAKRFTQINSLVRHKSLHERRSVEGSKIERGERETSTDPQESPQAKDEKTKRQYYCRTCGETFRFMTSLRNHKKLHEKIVRESGDKFSKKESRDNFFNKITIFNEDSRNQRNSIGKFIELAANIDSVVTESERGLSISDILSPYDCNDIELAGNLETRLYENSPSKRMTDKDYDIAQCLCNVDFASNVVSESSSPGVVNIDENITAESMAKERKFEKTFCSEENCSKKFVRTEDEESYVEISEERCVRNSCEKISLVEGILNVVESRVVDFHEKSFDDKIENKDFQDEKSRDNEIDREMPILRLVDTETGQQFYELIVDDRCNDFMSRDIQKNAEEFVSFVSLDDDEKKTSIPLDNRERAEKENANYDNYEETDNRDNNDNTGTPMVRLVQNEDGEQFFELVRESSEYEKNRGTEKLLENTLRFDKDDTKILNIDKERNAIDSIAGPKREKREISTENGAKIMKDQTRKFKCDECDKWFATAYNFKQHAGTHFYDQQKYRCEHCGLSFAWKSTLNKHLASNHRPDGPQKFVCEICPKVYSTLSQVNEHVKRDHLKERNHVCELCGKSFFKKFDLKTHRRIHTNERPYICRACGKSFHHQSHIIRHERIHSGERPYVCNVCQRTFAQPGSLKSHRQRHRDVKIDILEYRMDEDDPLTLAVH